MIRHLLLVVAPGVQAIYQCGLEPKEEIFQLFSQELHDSYVKQHGECAERLYFIVSSELDLPENERLTVTESQKVAMLAGAVHLEKMFKSNFPTEAANPNGISYQEKLEMLTAVLPPVFFEGTRFGKSGK